MLSVLLSHLRPHRDPRQARFLTRNSLHWIWQHRAFAPAQLACYWRLLMLRLRHPRVVLCGAVWLGRGVRFHCPAGAEIVLGRWVRVGAGSELVCYPNGRLTIDNRVVLGSNDSVHCREQVHIASEVLFADEVDVVDSDPITSDLDRPIQEQGQVTSPVRIGPDGWIAAKVTILRGSNVGRGCVLGASAVVRSHIPDYAIAVGAPARVVRDRVQTWHDLAPKRRELAEIAEQEQAAVQERLRRA